MARRIKIMNVTVNNDSSVTVEYESGTIRKYPLKKLPKTVEAWLLENEEPLCSPEEPIVEPIVEAEQVTALSIIPQPLHVEAEYHFILTPGFILKMILLGVGSFTLNFIAALCYFLADVVEGSTLIVDLLKDPIKKLIHSIGRFFRRTVDKSEVTINHIHHYAITVLLFSTVIVVVVTPIIRDWWNTSVKFRHSILSECRENMWFN